MINKHCDLIYCNSLKQSKANAKLYLLTNNYFKFLFQFQKYFLDLFAILNNNAASAHCVQLQMRRKGFPERGAERKPLVIRNKDAKNINNNVAFPKGRKIVKARKGLKPLVISINNSDNLSEKIKNLRFVINNFIHKEDIRMKNIKKFLTIILAISLLFAISCGDRPTGSTPIQSEATAMIDGEQVKITFYDANNDKVSFYDATSIEIKGVKYTKANN